MVHVCRDFIRSHSFLADSDVDLIWYIWTKQLLDMRIDITKEDAISLMRHWKNGDIASPFNISRSRRKCQELYPETRGVTYNVRHDQELQVIQDIRYAEEE